MHVLSAMHRGYPFLLLGGLLLILLPPMVRVAIPWELILAFVLPWIFWRNAQSWLNIEWRLSAKEVCLWLVVVLGLTLIVALLGNLAWLRATFFGVIAASMLWQTSRGKENSNLLANIGPLTLVFLIVGTSLALETPWRYIGSLFSGAAVGIFLGLLSIAVGKKVSPKYEGVISLGSVYLAYWAALAIDVSAIVAALFSVMAFSEFNLYRMDDHRPSIGIIPLDNRLTSFVILVLFIFMAWQVHHPAMTGAWMEVGLGLCIGLWVSLLGRRWRLPYFMHQSSVWRSWIQLSIFLFGMLILWPRGPELSPAVLWVGIGSAVFVPILSAILFSALNDLNAK